MKKSVFLICGDTMYKCLNKEIRNTDTGLKALITHMFHSINETYSVKLTYKDMTTLSYTHPEFSETFRKFIPHDNEYCAYVKVDSLFLNCLACQDRLRQKMKTYKKPFYGSCYAGVEEYFYPVVLNEKLVGIICAGIFCSDRKKGLEKVREAAKSNGKKPLVCEEKFLRSMLPPVKDVPGLLTQLGILSGLISHFYDGILQISGRDFESTDLKDLWDKSSNSEILSLAVCYIREHYCEDIYLNNVAAICHCNANYLSNLFVEKLHISFAEYINRSRVSLAKDLLLFTTLSVDEIGRRVGFRYTSYFIRIFKKYAGKTPFQFRKQKG